MDRAIVNDVYLNDLGLACALGRGAERVWTRLLAGHSDGMRRTEDYSPGRLLPCGQVTGELPALTDRPLAMQSRNNRLLLATLEQLRPALDTALGRHDPGRVAVVLGTSTSGIAEGEAAMAAHERDGRFPADFLYAQQELGSPAAFAARELGVQGPAYTVSTACSSSAHALGSAARLLRNGIADLVLCGGVDTLCRFTVAGFSALSAVSDRISNPFSRNRTGINIGEAAALFLMSREPAEVALRGYGASCDAHHMSAPAPDGRGAIHCIEAALADAGLPPAAVDYVNLHGTGTEQNDAMEARALVATLGAEVAASSTKPLTGHALGAAGALEAAFCYLALQADNQAGALPPHLWDGEADPRLPQLDLVEPGRRLGRRPRVALSTSFAFGGNNAALVLASCP